MIYGICVLKIIRLRKMKVKQIPLGKLLKEVKLQLDVGYKCIHVPLNTQLQIE